MVFDVRAALAILLLSISMDARTADMCPAVPAREAATNVAPSDHQIHIDSNSATLGVDGNAVLNGRVTIHQDARSLAADSVTYDKPSGQFKVAGTVEFEDPKLRVKSQSGTYDTAGGADFNEASFQLLDRSGHGVAHDMAIRPDGKLSLEQVRYTTCPVGNQDWMLQASSINLDTVLQEGNARGVYLRFKGVPILYTPIISFPIGNTRKSGFLFPTIGHSSNNGVEVSAPYYFNLAPNYDLTLSPGFLSARGVQLGAEFRFVTGNSTGQIDGTYLPSDALAHGERSYFRVRDITDFEPGLRLDVDVASVSDSHYFQDFAVGSEQTSVTYLERRADLRYFDDTWRVNAQLQNFQTIDTSIDALDRPYSRVPRVQAQGIWPLLNSNLEFVLASEAVNFLRTVGPSGVRLDLSPELRWSMRGAGYFFEPSAGWRFTQYDLQNASLGAPAAPTRSLPFVRLDTGLTFERDAGSEGQRTQTLEPRLVYSYVPYRSQTSLPLFDTGLPDFNLIELFRTNRFVGADRVSDADQISAGVTTRLFDHVTGQQYLSATLGQTRYFRDPRVTLLPGDPVESKRTSDVIAQISLTAYKSWSVNLDYDWNPYTSQTEKSAIAVQYHPSPDRVVNLAYRFQQDIAVCAAGAGAGQNLCPLKQWDGSFAWPVTSRWNTVGRLVYSLQDRQIIERLAGFEYRSCCWRVQMLQRRYVDSRPISTGPGGLDTSYILQLELTGLSSVGKPENSFLERSIRGYSTGDSQ